MRRITVGAYEKALVFKNGKLVNVLTEGKHWVSWTGTIQKYDVTELFYHQIDLDLLLANEKFASEVEVFTVRDNEIMIQYKNENLHAVLKPGTYCYWKDGLAYSYDLVDLNEVEVSDSINRKVLHMPVLSKYVRIHTVESYEKGLLYIDGKLVRALTAGVYYHWVSEKVAVVKKVDMRTQQVEINGQELLTKDKAAIRLNVMSTYTVVDVRKAIDEAKDYARQIYTLIQMGLREYVGQYSLDELLANKTAAGAYILAYAKSSAEEIGVEVLSCGIRDIILPGEVKDIMNQVLIAEKKAQANVIMRREETASTRGLLNTAKLMEDNEMLFRLKEMEYIEKISEKIGEITVNGGSQVMDQLRGLVSVKN